MGGYGSGRRRGSSARCTVEACDALDINWMTREGIFDGGGVRGGLLRWLDDWDEETSCVRYELDITQRWLRLYYKLMPENELTDYKIPLTTTALPWGGVRWWFVCGLICDGHYCGRRVAKLYHPPDARYFGCRHCYDLTYKCCQDSRRCGDVWLRVGDAVGRSAVAIKRMWEEEVRWDQWVERQRGKDKQRRRRRKARNWM